MDCWYGAEQGISWSTRDLSTSEIWAQAQAALRAAMKYTNKPLVDRESLRPRKALWDDALFQTWVSEIEEEISDMEQKGLLVPIGSEHSESARMLKLIGMSAPKTGEESIRVYLSFRAVVHYWEWKLGQLKSESEKFTKLEKELNESQAGTANDVTRRGSGIRRFQPTGR